MSTECCSFFIGAGSKWRNLSEKNMAYTIIQTLITKQSLLFNGYLRLNQMIGIPLDIMQLCQSFFVINLGSSEYLYSLHEIARICWQQQEYYIAYELLKPLTIFNSDNPTYFNTLGLVCHHLNLFEESLSSYKIALKLKPKCHIYRWNMGLLYESKEKYHIALKLYLEAAELDPKESEYFYKSANCYVQLKEYEKAKINYVKAIKLDSTKSHYFIHYANLLCIVKEYEGAQIIFEKAIILQPENWRQVYEFAKLLRMNNQFETAEIYYKKCIKINDQIGFVIVSYAHLCYLMKRFNDAIKYLTIAKDLPQVNYAWYNYYFGLVQYSLGNQNESDKYLKESIQYFDLSNDGLNMCLKHLDTFKKQDPENIMYAIKCEVFLQEAAQRKRH